MLCYSFIHAPINWQWSREGRVLITVWVVPVRVSVSCALKGRKTGATIVQAYEQRTLPTHTDEWKKWGADDRTQAIAVPFLLFLFHTISRHLWFIDIGARGSTPTHQPFMELPDQENKFPDIIKKVRRGKAPLKEKALLWRGRNDHRQAQDSKLESSYSTLVSWDRALIYADP